jgi:hypothetical protein
MPQNKFSNFSGSNVYVWHRNHDSPEGEDAIGQDRTLTRDPSIGGAIGGGVLQQGDDGPIEIKMTGKIWHMAQYTRMWDFWNLSRTETIMFTDFTGADYEVMFNSFQPKRVGLLINNIDPTNCPNYRWDYTMTLTVITIFSGPLYGRIFQFA